MVDMGHTGNQQLGNQSLQPYWQAQPPRPNTYEVTVSGEEEAMNYHVALNTIVKMWDANKPVIYIKSVDSSGIPSIRILDYTVRKTEEVHKESTGISKEDFASLKDSVASLIKQVKELKKNG